MMYVPRGLLLQGKARQAFRQFLAAILHARHYKGCSLFQEKIIHVLHVLLQSPGIEFGAMGGLLKEL
jgi:hypothetical protein